MEGIQTFKGSWPWPWIRPYGIPSCITHRPLPIYQISLKSNKLFVDGRTDVQTDGHFPPLILLGRLLEVDLKMEGIQTFKGSWPWPWPWIGPYGIPSCITHRPLPIYQISLKSKKLFVDGRTDGRTFFPPLILLGRLLEVDLKTSCWLLTCRNVSCENVAHQAMNTRKLSRTQRLGQCHRTERIDCR